MFSISQGIRSLTEFKAKTPAFLEELKKTEQALVLTVNGKAELVALSAGAFEKILEKLDQLDSLLAVRSAIAQADRGEGRPAKVVLDEIRKEAGLLPKERP